MTELLTLNIGISRMHINKLKNGRKLIYKTTHSIMIDGKEKHFRIEVKMYKDKKLDKGRRI